MPLSFDGAGIITGLQVGGLPDGTVDQDTLAIDSVATAKIVDDAVTEAKTGFTGNLQFNSGYGSAATAYGVRAWVCFNGNNGTLLEDGNVSSITDNSTGNYTINFATNMPDTNYAAAGNSDGNGTNGCNFGPPAVGSIGMLVYSVGGTFGDHDKVFAIIVR